MTFKKLNNKTKLTHIFLQEFVKQNSSCRRMNYSPCQRNYSSSDPECLDRFLSLLVQRPEKTLTISYDDQEQS